MFISHAKFDRYLQWNEGKQNQINQSKWIFCLFFLENKKNENNRYDALNKIYQFTHLNSIGNGNKRLASIIQFAIAHLFQIVD